VYREHGGGSDGEARNGQIFDDRGHDSPAAGPANGFTGRAAGGYRPGEQSPGGPGYRPGGQPPGDGGPRHSEAMAPAPAGAGMHRQHVDVDRPAPGSEGVGMESTAGAVRAGRAEAHRASVGMGVRRGDRVVVVGGVEHGKHPAPTDDRAHQGIPRTSTPRFDPYPRRAPRGLELHQARPDLEPRRAHRGLRQGRLPGHDWTGFRSGTCGLCFPRPRRSCSKVRTATPTSPARNRPPRYSLRIATKPALHPKRSCALR